jgi:protein TonB
VRNFVYLCFAALLSAALILSIPALSILIGQKQSGRRPPQQRAMAIERVEMVQPQQQQRERIRPRQRSTPQPMRSGPRLAMALGVEGSGGAAVPLSMVNPSGSRGGSDAEGVDERPQLLSPLEVQIPDGVKKAERNAEVRLMFCVDLSGKPYNIKISQESPPGLGLGDAAVQALQKTTFKPAIRDAQPVPFCGMEQPIAIKFRS